MKSAIVVLTLATFAAAQPGPGYGIQGYGGGGDGYGARKPYGGGYGVKVESYFSYGSYNGQYPGKCGADGFYYNDANTFVICSNGNAYVQPCAPGSRNSGASRYQYGKDYSYNDFCDVNLVDYGYGAHFGYGSGGYGSGGYGGGGFGGGGYSGGGYGGGGYGGSGYGGGGYGGGYRSRSYGYGSSGYGSGSSYGYGH